MSFCIHVCASHWKHVKTQHLILLVCPASYLYIVGRKTADFLYMAQLRHMLVFDDVGFTALLTVLTAAALWSFTTAGHRGKNNHLPNEAFTRDT